ncbi:MAG: histidine kinase, partial [Rhodothermales bacterium]|nr:histidine kinase [Rhodothermales bacterium]
DPDRFFAGWRLWVVAFVFWTVVGILGFLYQYLDVFTRGFREPFHEKLIEELTGSYGTGILFPFIALFVRRLRRSGVRWYGALAAHLAFIPIYSIVHTTWNWLSRELAYVMIGLGAYDYGILPIRYAMEFPNDVIDYAILATIVYLFDHYRSAKDQETRVAQLEAELTGARLRSLQSQLQPHSLFNALNTISSVMHTNVEAADRMLTKLGDLLRRTLRSSDAQEIPLQRELETLELYLDIMRARFAERLEVAVEVDAGAEHGLVPQLLLQPLVENALRHGNPGLHAAARLVIAARRRDGMLVLRVEDNGAGVSQDLEELKSRGVGLRNTTRRLEHLYGEHQSLSLVNRPGGGLTVSVTLPFRIADGEASHRA